MLIKLIYWCSTRGQNNNNSHLHDTRNKPKNPTFARQIAEEEKVFIGLRFTRMC